MEKINNYVNIKKRSFVQITHIYTLCFINNTAQLLYYCTTNFTVYHIHNYGKYPICKDYCGFSHRQHTPKLTTFFSRYVLPTVIVRHEHCKLYNRCLQKNSEGHNLVQWLLEVVVNKFCWSPPVHLEGNTLLILSNLIHLLLTVVSWAS